MAFVVNPKREVTFHHTYVPKEGEPIEFSVTFKFTASEDIDYVQLRDKAADKTPLIVEDKETGKETKTEMGTYNAFLYTLRTSLISCEGIEDPEGKKIVITDDNGKINEDNQIAVFESIRSEQELFDKIIVAYVGHKEKNG